MNVVRIIRTPAIESAIARFDSWWDARSHREQIMLSVLGTIVGLLVLIYLVILPLQNARAKAFADIRTYETLNARLRAAGQLTPNRAAPRRGPPIEVVQNSAATMGLTVQAEATPGGVRATFADTGYDALVGWIAELGATSRLVVKQVTITRLPEAGHVSAVVEFGA